jgi:hypothetical protein
MYYGYIKSSGGRGVMSIQCLRELEHKLAMLGSGKSNTNGFEILENEDDSLEKLTPEADVDSEREEYKTEEVENNGDFDINYYRIDWAEHLVSSRLEFYEYMKHRKLLLHLTTEHNDSAGVQKMELVFDSARILPFVIQHIYLYVKEKTRPISKKITADGLLELCVGFENVRDLLPPNHFVVSRRCYKYVRGEEPSQYIWNGNEHLDGFESFERISQAYSVIFNNITRGDELSRDEKTKYRIYGHIIYIGKSFYRYFPIDALKGSFDFMLQRRVKRAGGQGNKR